ncbi:hypothetical protein TCAL_09625 [Tigriopus californicus]|uniref:Uncharacterized protein n=1 Tax=Tigriopus californicus TaxID=6832 RepID=A0A553NTR0_TIGCA|nr:hypothetical protein TCAL_09625 [Tigriopus californicus]
MGYFSWPLNELGLVEVDECSPFVGSGIKQTWSLRRKKLVHDGDNNSGPILLALLKRHLRVLEKFDGTAMSGCLREQAFFSV